MTRVAIVHDWLTGMRGGERCLEAMLDLYPAAEIFTLLHVPGSVSRKIEDRPIHASFIARLPRAADLYRYYLPLFPAAIERLDLRGFDLVISISHCVAKGVRTPPGVPHLCYCLTPMRYVWDLYDAYFGGHSRRWWTSISMPLAAAALRRWDVASATRADAYIAISRHIARRIRRCYDREAGVVYPPVEVDRFRPATAREDFYLCAGALVPYKRVDLIVDAFNRLDRRLVVIGTGPELSRIRRAAGPNITFLGRVTDAAMASWLGRCRAFVFAAEEDFGITVVEAQAAGAPVIAYSAGGALETVVDAEHPAHPCHAPSTGVMFDAQTPDALIDAIARFESRTFEPPALRANAGRFTLSAFQDGIRAGVESLVPTSEAPATAAVGGER